MIIDSLYTLRRVTEADLMRMSEADLLRSARFSRKAVSSQIRKLTRENLIFSLDELGYREGESPSQIPRNATRGQLIRIITENQITSLSPVWTLTEARKYETQVNEFIREEGISQESAIELMQNSSWFTRLEAIGFDSGDIYRMIVDHQEASFFDVYRSLVNEYEYFAIQREQYGINIR